MYAPLSIPPLALVAAAASAKVELPDPGPAPPPAPEPAAEVVDEAPAALDREAALEAIRAMAFFAALAESQPATLDLPFVGPVAPNPLQRVAAELGRPDPEVFLGLYEHFLSRRESAEAESEAPEVEVAAALPFCPVPNPFQPFQVAPAPESELD